MSEMGYDELIGDTLAQVNVVRKAFGQEELNELPNARKGATADCLFYRALEGAGIMNVGGADMQFSSERTANYVANLWGTEATGNSVKSPSQFREIIRAFDDGQLNYYAIGSEGDDDDEE